MLAFIVGTGIPEMEKSYSTIGENFVFCQNGEKILLNLLERRDKNVFVSYGYQNNVNTGKSPLKNISIHTIIK